MLDLPDRVSGEVAMSDSPDRVSGEVAMWCYDRWSTEDNT